MFSVAFIVLGFRLRQAKEERSTRHLFPSLGGDINTGNAPVIPWVTSDNPLPTGFTICV